MSDTVERPAALQINGWSPDLSNWGEIPSRTPWAQRRQGQKPSEFLAAPPLADLRDWQHPEVGWGLVLPEPEDDSIPSAARASADDAPAPLRKLLAARPGSPVLRWGPKLDGGYLRRYYPDGRVQDLSIEAPTPGVGFGRIPRYLLLGAGPSRIPWYVQYALNMSTFVGRLDLPEPELALYVDALITDWPAATSKPTAPLLWSADHGAGDITWLMARAIAGRLWEKYQSDSELTGRLWLRDADATAGKLADSLIERAPGLVVTTSHGVTGPTAAPDLLRSQLGMPVGVDHIPLAAADLGSWKPSGAIWYAHACCSAGSDATSRYKNLLPQDNAISLMLSGVAEAAGAMTAPLPRSLLGREQPLRAFVGHVEPTFDWTLRDPATRQPLTHVLAAALHDKLYQGDRRTPIGFALRSVFEQAGSFFAAWDRAISGINANLPNMRDRALYTQLVAMDRQTTVILGDPTVSLSFR